MDYAFWADALAFAVEAEIEDLFVAVLGAGFLWWNALEILCIGHLRCSNFTSIGSTTKRAPINPPINPNRASFIITVFAIPIAGLISHLATPILRIQIAIRSNLSIRSSIRCGDRRLDHRFEHIDALGIEGGLLVALLADDYLAVTNALHWRSCSFSSRKLDGPRRSSGRGRGRRRASRCLRACSRTLCRIGAIGSSFLNYIGYLYGAVV